MPAKRKIKPAPKPAKKASRGSNSGAKRAKVPEPRPGKPPSKKSPIAKSKTARKTAALDLSAFPADSVSHLERSICLACVANVFMRQLKLAPRTAHLEIRRYAPTLAELYAQPVTRPWFDQPAPRCPYCGAPSKLHALLRVDRIESSKTTDALRRKLIKSLPRSNEQFMVLEEKATQQHAFFDWLERISMDLNLDDPAWLHEVARHYLSRKDPKTGWGQQFDEIRSIRRSRRLDSGWETDQGRLFLASALFDELLLVHYLVSRSHRAGGLTLEGRYTLPELIARLRNAGYLRTLGVHMHNPADALEQLVIHLGGGDSAIKFHHILDRRDFLEAVKRL